MLSKTVAFSAVIASAAAFSPASLSGLPSARTGATSTCMANRFPQGAPSGAPPADLFNIWRDDYMLSPQQAAAEAAERKKNTLFDGVLPPFSNVGKTDRGDDLVSPTLQGLGVARDFSTANPTSAYDTSSFGRAVVINPDIIANPKTGAGPEKAAFEKQGLKAPNPVKRLFGRK